MLQSLRGNSDVGGEVTWINNDNTIHTATAGNLTVDANAVGFDYPNGFDSSIFSPGAEFSYKFEKAGTYPYFCTVHAWMVGIVNVEGETTDDHHEDGEMHEKSLEDVMATITHGDAIRGSPLSIDVKVTELDGGKLEHVNFKVMAKQGNEIIYESEKEHAHEGMATIQTGPLPMDASDEMPIDITVELLGFGIDEITGPSGKLAEKQVVPEFGTIAMMILAISIVSIIAITARSRIIPRI